MKKYLIWSIEKGNYHDNEVIVWRVEDAPDNTVKDAARIALGRREGEDEFAAVMDVSDGMVSIRHGWLTELAGCALDALRDPIPCVNGDQWVKKPEQSKEVQP